MALAAITLDDKYRIERGRVFLSGSQALTRLPMMQRARDVARGLNTAGFISGYRGSPLGGFDRELWRAKSFLDEHHIHFRPGVNEDLAATSIWGSQQVNMYEGARYDGVFAMWYGKGAGLDRSGDAMRHANGAGTSPHGGVLAVVGDDHALKSSSQAYNCEPTFVDLMMPVLYPADLQELLDYGLYGFAMSRFSGCWVGFKVLADTVDTTATIDVDPDRVEIVLPEDFSFSPGGPHIRWPDPWAQQEVRLQREKIPAALAFARANGLNRVALESPRPRFGIITAGKSYGDVRQALHDLGLDEARAAAAGITVYKVAMPWPLDADAIRRFASGLEEVLVVEEKRRIIETHARDVLYDLPANQRPRVIGRYDEEQRPLLPSVGEISPDRLARVIAGRIATFHESEALASRLAFLDARESANVERPDPGLARTAYFCSGCPHNTSTRVPEGSRAIAGVGCHYMAVGMERSTSTFTQMGGEGAPWIGQAPFTDTEHVFTNLGDGTYYHSGLLAIRAALAAEVNITYKILFNDAVAMTGGQPIDGPLSVPMITHQVHAEGVRRIAVVSDEPDKYPAGAGFAPGVTFHHRDEMDQVQKELRTVSGVSVLLYDQVCAAEKRRRRKRGAMADPGMRVFINEAVCEGCGDCSTASNCLSVVPVETEFGRKRTIDQWSCNMDFSCVNGFCPSFVTVRGGRLRRPDTSAAGEAVALPEPDLPAIPEGGSHAILITGVGGTGVVTLSALLGMAAHLEGKGASAVDMLGMSQKFGAVMSHVRIAARPEHIRGSRLNSGAARLLLGCDLLVAAGREALDTVDPGVTRAIVNSHEAITGAFTRDPDLEFPGAAYRDLIGEAVGAERTEFIEATRLSNALLGDPIATNLLMLGYAYQRGLVPVSAEALERAIELNGVAVEASKRAFRLGRETALDPEAVRARAEPVTLPTGGRRLSATLDEAIERRVEDLTAYQDAAYAARYRQLVERVRQIESDKVKGSEALSWAAARAYYKLLAYKDEYEVARLYAEGDFMDRLRARFEGDVKLSVHLAPPILDRAAPGGRPTKRTFGPWVFTLFRVLARLKGLRGTPLDVFGYSEDRRVERRLIVEYERILAEVLADLTPEKHALAVAIAGIPEQIRGYGPVKEEHIARAKVREAELLAEFRGPRAPVSAAA